MSDTPGAAAARAGMSESMERNRVDVGLASETISLLRSEIRLGLTDGIREGIKAAVEDDDLTEAFFAAGMRAMRKQATVTTGKVVLDGFGSLFTRFFWLWVFFIALWSLAGWDGVKALGLGVWRIVVKG
jgi:hypothetical protein